MSVHRIAHVSDPHILAPSSKSEGHGIRVRYVNLGRVIDAAARRTKLERALVAAKKTGADHFVVSGDLTELGTTREFEEFASALDAAKLPADSVTLVPGNHDAYSSSGSWKTAIEGPLRPYAAGSASEPGKVVDRGGVAFLPLDVTCYQTVARSGGEFTHDASVALERRLGDSGLRSKALVVVQHHPPIGFNPILHWFDGLRGHTRLLDLLARFAHAQVLHGHLHRVIDRLLGGLGRSRIFGAPAIVEDDGVSRVRLYEVRDGALESAGLVAT
jgi:3',5'-cyclic AMP phosphodiesterase CpdA